MVQLQLRGRGIFATGDSHSVDVPPHTFLDDMTVLLEAGDTPQLLSDLALTASLVQGLAAEFGVSLNLGRAKTEAIVVQGSAGTYSALASLERANEATGMVFCFPSERGDTSGWCSLTATWALKPQLAAVSAVS